MPFVIQDKASGVQHTLSIEDPDDYLKIKRELVRRTDLRAHHRKQLYVHVPYCYFHCSFCVYKGEIFRNKRQTNDFVDQVGAEIEGLAPIVQDVVFQGAFVGGGTVTVLDATQLQWLLSTINSKFNLGGADCEFTVELAPHGLTPAKLDVLVAQRVNRVTMGMQSLDSKLLLSMNRPAIDLSRLKSTVDSIHDRPFADVNFDLMVGIPGRTYSNLRADFDLLQGWGCKSIMIYIDMRTYRDEARRSELAGIVAMIERLANEKADSYVLNGGKGVNEYNRFVSHRHADRSTLTSRYSTDYQESACFCLGIGRQAKSWNSDLVFSWH